MSGRNAEDLGASGTPSTADTMWDWQRNSLAALFEVRPHRTVTLRLGARQVDRTLNRNGFGRPNRDTDFRSDPDRSVTAGVGWRATSWFSLNADYEGTEVDQPFTAVSPYESKRAKARLVFTPKDGAMRAVVGYTDSQNDNTAVNFRTADNLGDPGCDPTDPSQAAGTCRWNSTADSTRYDLSWTHRVVPRVDYLLRYAKQELKTSTDVNVNSPVPGLDIYEADTTHGLAQVNFSWAEPWKAYVRFWIADADGVNPLIATDFTDNATARIMQDYRDGELGIRYTFPSRVFVGGSYRVFDYDDRNDLLDYDGSIFTLNAGLAF